MQEPVDSIDTPCFLAVDLGTSGCKTTLIALPGVVLASAFQSVPLHVLPGGGAEQSPTDWWAAFLTTAKQVLLESGAHAQRVVAVCCSSQGEGTIPVGRDGQPLADALLWMDMRGAQHVASHVRGLVKIAGYNAFKLYQWIRLTGGAPALSGKDPAGHMLYFRNERPELFQRTYKFLNVLDYLNLRLTGRFVATYDSILTSWVTDNRDPNRIRFHSGLVKASGVDRDKFPEIVPCTEVLGTLVREVAEELGLSPDTKVVAGAVDTTAAAVGCGAVLDNQAHLYVGTSAWLAAHVPRKKTNPFASLASVPCAIPGRYLMIGLQTAAGANLAYLRDNLVLHNDEMSTTCRLEDAYAAFDRVASKVEPGSRGLIYTPWLYGERCPVDDATLRAGVFNLSLEHNRADVIRAIFEGVALNTRWMLRPVSKFLGHPVESLVMIGGGATSAVWCQIFADVLDVPIHVPRDPLMANSLGAAFIAAVGLGYMSFDEIPEKINYNPVLSPNPANRNVYDDRFATFLEIHKRLRPIYRRWNQPRGGPRG